MHIQGLVSKLILSLLPEELGGSQPLPLTAINRVFPLLALNMTSASSFQMLRGAVIIFTGLFSVAFLGRRLAPSQWVGILATIAGLVVVGLADLLSKHDSQHKLSDVITGEASWGPEAASLGPSSLEA